MTWAVIFVIGAVIGLVVGRWWALLAALGVFLWLGTSTPVESPPPWVLALMVAAFIAAGIAVGVTARAALRRAGNARRNTPG